MNVRGFMGWSKNKGQRPPINPYQPTPTLLWEFGPTINGRNYSVGMPAGSTDGSFEFPVGFRSANHYDSPSVHYVTRSSASLLAAGEMSMDYSISGLGLEATQEPDGGPPDVSLYFECANNDWASDGGRWWSKAIGPLTPGQHALSVPLMVEHWVTVQNDRPDLWNNALTLVTKIGFTFGGPQGGKGHGVYATAPGVRFVLNSFSVL